jgi:hypothetical protein
VTNLRTHLDWLQENRPSLMCIYFKNNWNPQCSKQLEREFLKFIKFQPFESFVVDGSLGGTGERVKKYYDVVYEPSFMLLSDGMELKRVISGDIEDLKT